MSDEYIVNTVRSTSSGVHGRSLNSAGHHHFVIDGPNLAEEIGSVDAVRGLCRPVGSGGMLAKELPAAALSLHSEGRHGH